MLRSGRTQWHKRHIPSWRCIDLTRLLFVLASALTPTSAFAQQFNSHLYGGLRWRVIGPFRGGRTVAAAGIPSQPHVFDFGLDDGGVWAGLDYVQARLRVFDSA